MRSVEEQLMTAAHPSSRDNDSSGNCGCTAFEVLLAITFILTPRPIKAIKSVGTKLFAQSLRSPHVALTVVYYAHLHNNYLTS